MSVLGRRWSRRDGLVCTALAFVAIAVWKLRIIDPAFQPFHVMANADFFTQIYPMSHRMAEWMRAGVLPLWNPYQYAGHPFLATGLYGVLYPPNVLYLLLPTHVAIEALMVFHLIVCGTTMYAFARAIGLTRLAATFAGFAFMLSGFIVGQSAWFNPANAAAAWLPLMLLAIERLVTTRRAQWLVVLAAAVALAFLPGWPQTWMYAMWAAGGYAAVRIAGLLRRRATRADAVRAGPLIAAGFALGAALMTAQLLPGLELQRLGPRRAGGLTIEQAAALAPTMETVAKQVVDANPGHSRLAYAGTVTLVLLPLALFVRHGRPRALYFICLGLAALGVVLTVYTPVFRIYRLLPGAAWFRVPPRLLYLWATGAALAAAHGVDVLVRATDDSRSRRIRTALLPTAVALTLVAFGTLPQLGLVYLGLAIVLVWAATFTDGALRRWTLAALVVLAATDLALAIKNPFMHPFHDPSVFRKESVLLDYVRDHQGLDRTYINTTFNTPQMMSKQGTLWGIYSITDYEPLSLERYDQFFRLIELPKDRRPSIQTFTGSLRASPASPTFGLLDLLSVRFAIVERSGDSPLDGLRSRAPKWRPVPVAPLSPYVLYENTDPLPRAYVSFAPRVVESPEQALAALTSDAFAPRRDVVLEAAAPVAFDAAAPAIAPAVIARYEPQRVVVETDAPRAGHLVLTDTWYPGWRADVDGAPVEILRANYLFRAVAVPVGRHTVTFTYAPTSFRIGALISSLAVLVSIGVVLMARRARER